MLTNQEVKTQNSKIFSGFKDQNNNFMVDEFNHRYSGTLVGLERGGKDSKGSNKVIPFKVNSIDHDNNLEGTNYANGRGMISKLDEKTVNLVPPELGIVPYKESVLFTYCSRNTNWKRGFVLNSIQAKDPLSTDSISLDLKYLNSLGTHRRLVINSIFNPLYTPFLEAMEILLGGGRRAIALNYHFFVAISSQSENIVLGYKQRIVGEFNSGGKLQLGKKVEHLRDEIETLIQ